MVHSAQRTWGLYTPGCVTGKAEGANINNLAGRRGGCRDFLQSWQGLGALVYLQLL